MLNIRKIYIIVFVMKFTCYVCMYMQEYMDVVLVDMHIKDERMVVLVVVEEYKITVVTKGCYDIA